MLPDTAALLLAIPGQQLAASMHVTRIWQAALYGQWLRVCCCAAHRTPPPHQPVPGKMMIPNKYKTFKEGFGSPGGPASSMILCSGLPSGSGAAAAALKGPLRAAPLPAALLGGGAGAGRPKTQGSHCFSQRTTSLHAQARPPGAAHGDLSTETFRHEVVLTFAWPGDQLEGQPGPAIPTATGDFGKLFIPQPTVPTLLRKYYFVKAYESRAGSSNVKILCGTNPQRPACCLPVDLLVAEQVPEGGRGVLAHPERGLGPGSSSSCSATGCRCPCPGTCSVQVGHALRPPWINRW